MKNEANLTTEQRYGKTAVTDKTDILIIEGLPVNRLKLNTEDAREWANDNDELRIENGCVIARDEDDYKKLVDAMRDDGLTMKEV